MTDAETKTGKKSTIRYTALDGVRAYSCLGIVAMHVMANDDFNLDSVAGNIIHTIISPLGSLTALFMMVSAFSLCCGYYDKVITGNFDVETFYGRRFSKIWPFFALLTLLDIAISPSIHSIYEGAANLTLMFGFLPNPSIDVIGVGWFLGLIFVFYLIFPFFCYLMSNNCRAFIALAVAVALYFLCKLYFYDEAHVLPGTGTGNIIYCSIYFVTGGVIYKFREVIARFTGRFRLLSAVAVIALAVAFFLVPSVAFVELALFSAITAYVIGQNNQAGGGFSNQFMRFLSGISLEVYLCHMLIFRVIQKAGLTHMFGGGLLSYAVTFIATAAGAMVFAFCASWGMGEVKNYYAHSKETVI
jgi:peptidoglycan/LPS O-acetylase OafA/YrhL